MWQREQRLAVLRQLVADGLLEHLEREDFKPVSYLYVMRSMLALVPADTWKCQCSSIFSSFLAFVAHERAQCLFFQNQTRALLFSFQFAGIFATFAVQRYRVRFTIPCCS
jgi:hypothetical protein